MTKQYFFGGFLAAVMSVGVASWAQAQERRPVSERPESKDGGAQPAFAATSGRLPQDNDAAAPHLVKFSGVLLDVAGEPLSGEVEVTFALYKQEVDEEPLWTETQRVDADERGGYTVLLGVTQPTGMPSELFRSDEARWLSVQVQGQAQQTRTLLVSVPYALKAADAEKLGGKSLADFVLSESLGDQVRRVIQGQTAIGNPATPMGTLQPGQARANGMSSSPAVTTGPKFPPSTFSGTNSTQIVSVQQNGTGSGLIASTPSSMGASALIGLATSTSTSNSVFQNGVYGQNDGTGAGVAGIATNPSVGVGVYGQSANFAGVFGQTFNPNTNGVSGSANATSGFSIGVSGFSASASGAGVFGNAGATSGSANGIQGQTASPFGAGVFGIAAPNGQSTGVYGQTVNWVGVGGQALATSGSPAYGVWGDSVSTGGSGVAGFEDATSGFTNGVFGQSASTSGTGVAGFATAISGNTTGVGGQSFSASGNGVLGVSNAVAGNFNNGVLGVNNATAGNAYGVSGSTQTSGFGAGVAGAAFATTGTAFGVFGQAHSPNGTAVFGTAASSSGFPTAVVGFLDSPQGGVAGQFVAHDGVGLILQGLSGANFNQVFSLDANGNLNISGNLTVNGTKSSTAKLQNGREVALYAVESPENWFEDFGSAELKSGAAWVPLDSSFAEATNTGIAYHVFLTPNGDSNGLYVARKTAAGFEVREHGGGGSTVAFDYRIVVRRRGYETVRMAEVHGDVKTAESSRLHLIELTNSGTLAKRGVVEASRNAAAPAIRPVPRTVAPAQAIQPVPQVPKMEVPRR